MGTDVSADTGAQKRLAVVLRALEVGAETDGLSVTVCRELAAALAAGVGVPPDAGEQLAEVQRWFVQQPWRGDPDPGSFGGHGYSDNERKIGYGTWRDPRFLPTALLPEALAGVGEARPVELDPTLANSGLGFIVSREPGQK